MRATRRNAGGGIGPEGRTGRASTARTAAAASSAGRAADAPNNAAAPANANGDGHSAAPPQTMTMAELELRRYIAAQDGTAAGSPPCSPSSSGAAAANGGAGAGAGGRKRRRSARASSDGDRTGGGGGVDYHRVRTARMTRLEEMFWRDDAGYDSDDDEEEKDDDDERAENNQNENDDDGDDGDGDAGISGDWRLVRRLPVDTWLRCDGNGCRRKAVAVWVEVPAADADAAARRKGKADGKKQEVEENKEDEEEAEEEEEWNVCLACQRREFADQIGPDGRWPAYVDSVPTAMATTSNAGIAAVNGTNANASANASHPAATPKPPVHLNYGRRLHLTKVHDSPHIYVIDNFLTRGELRHLDGKIADAESGGTFERSFVDKGDGHGRTRRNRRNRRRNRKGMANGDHDGNDDNDGEEKKEEEEEEEDVDGDGNGGDGDDGGDAAKKDDGKRQTTDEKQRTSKFIHFGKMADSKIAAIEARAAELLQLPHSSIEPLQLVRYGPGQYFREHHDMGVLFDDGSVELPPRVLAGVPRRVVTILVYLNDLPVEAGGGTQFPYLSKTGFGMKDDDDEEDDVDGGGVVIHPKRGRAVVWANIDQTGWPDPRTVHEGLPLIRGAKMPSAPAKAGKKKEIKKEKAPKKEKKPKPKKAKKPRKSRKKPPPPPRPPTDQILRYIVVPRSDPTNPLSSFGMKVASIGPDGRTVLTTDWEHPHMAQRLGLQLGRLKKDDVILSVNGHKVFDPVTEKVLLPFRVVVPLIRATKPGRAMKLDVLRYAPKVKIEEVKTEEDGSVVDGREQPDAAVSNEITETAAGDVKIEAEVCSYDGAKGDEEIEKVKSGSVEEACKEDAQVKEEPETELELDMPKAKPLPLLKYAMNIWACEE